MANCKQFSSKIHSWWNTCTWLTIPNFISNAKDVCMSKFNPFERGPFGGGGYGGAQPFGHNYGFGGTSPFGGSNVLGGVEFFGDSGLGGRVFFWILWILPPTTSSTPPLVNVRVGSKNKLHHTHVCFKRLDYMLNIC